MSLSQAQWFEVESLFGDALALAPGERARLLAERTIDSAVRAEVELLLAASDTGSDFLARPVGIVDQAREGATLAAGASVGAWRIVRFIARGGMGEVYEAERAAGDFEQRAALKLLWRTSPATLGRFHVERQIVARLDHPGIARLLDGGFTPAGTPYAVFELVHGVPISAWCRERLPTLPERLRLFGQVCEAVAHAHRNLIVHRDLKPANILVDDGGRVRLVDFGIAKLLDPFGGAGHVPTTQNAFTPEYAAPEQLSGKPVTTATDVHALGLLLFELLTGERAFSFVAVAPLVALRTVMESPPSVPSVTARSSKNAPVPPLLLRGDLDAIVERCLRKDPADRYPSVDGLRLDIERTLRGEPVTARGGGRLYVLSRFVRRHRLSVAAACAVLVAIVLGATAISWQARRATREAARAVAIKDFLVSVFRASDIRIAADRPRDQITAKELLDASAGRVANEFQGDTELQVELLQLLSEIYGYLGDDERFATLMRQGKELARKNFGETHPAVIQAVLLEGWEAFSSHDYGALNRKIEEADRLIRTGGHERTTLRAEWWMIRERALLNESSSLPARAEAVTRAVDLYRAVAPRDVNLVLALANLATIHFLEEDNLRARSRIEEGIAAYSAALQRSDGDLAVMHTIHAEILAELREYDAADAVYAKGVDLVRRTFGEKSGTYWRQGAAYARYVHARGDRERAHRMFEALWPLIPERPKDPVDAMSARMSYAEALVEEGRAALALPWLERAEKFYREHARTEADLRFARLKLGDAYERLGRRDEARRTLKEAHDESLARDSRGSTPSLVVRERWGRLLLADGKLDAAEAELRTALEEAGPRKPWPIARVMGSLASVALARANSRLALDLSSQAIETLALTTGSFDVRLEPALWRIRADAFAANGDLASARDWHARAVAVSRRYDAPSSSTAAEAR